MADTWNIRGRSDHCSLCERPFEPGTPCFSELAAAEERYERRDLCASCRERDEERPSPVSRWRSVYTPPAPPPPEPIQRNTAEDALRRLADDPAPAAANTRFILALMLERKRVLRCRDRFTAEDGALVFVYEHAPSGDTFLVVDPGLTPAQAADVQKDVSSFLQNADSPADGPADSPADEPADDSDRGSADPTEETAGVSS